MYIWMGVCSLGRKIHICTHKPHQCNHTANSILLKTSSLVSSTVAMPSSSPNTQHPSPVQSPRGTAGGNASASQTAHATRPYTNIVACNGTLVPGDAHDSSGTNAPQAPSICLRTTATEPDAQVPWRCLSSRTRGRMRIVAKS